jgi:hypothetical protein
MNRLLTIALIACGLLACHGNPASPDRGPLATGRWTGQGACLSVTETGCNLTLGCGHGQFPRPMISSNGMFDVEGTYRIEVGPISIDPAPPAHFLGSVTGSRLTLTVIPTAALSPATYSMTPTNAGACSVPCV